MALQKIVLPKSETGPQASGESSAQLGATLDELGTTMLTHPDFKVRLNALIQYIKRAQPGDAEAIRNLHRVIVKDLDSTIRQTAVSGYSRLVVSGTPLEAVNLVMDQLHTLATIDHDAAVKERAAYVYGELASRFSASPPGSSDSPPSTVPKARRSSALNVVLFSAGIVAAVAVTAVIVTKR